MAEPDDYQKRVEDALREGKPIPGFPTMPEDPFNDLDALAMSQRAVVETYEKNGFSHADAMYLTACMFTGNPGAAPSGG